MKVYNKDKTKVLTEYDLEKGYLERDTIIIHIEAVEGNEEVSHYEVVAEYPNGGKDVERVIDVPGVEAVPAHDEEEEIRVYIPYTEEQLKEKAEEEYKQNIVNKIRKKYSLSDELAIIRQRNVKTEEFDEYYDFVERCKSEAKAELNRE